MWLVSGIQSTNKRVYTSRGTAIASVLDHGGVPGYDVGRHVAGKCHAIIQALRTISYGAGQPECLD